MVPISFPEQTIILQANPLEPEIDGQEVGLLPVFSDGQQCVSCWKLSLAERLQILFFGRIWLGIHTGQTQPPVWLSTEKNVFDE